MHRDIHVYTLTLVCTHIYTPPHREIQYSYTYKSIDTQICTLTIYIHTHTLMHIHVLIQTHTVTYPHMHTHIPIHTHLCMFTY